jgi:hypothetical protein
MPPEPAKPCPDPRDEVRVQQSTSILPAEPRPALALPEVRNEVLHLRHLLPAELIHAVMIK